MNINSGTSEGRIKIMLLIFLVINGMLLLFTSFMPFVDLPNHLAEATIYKYYDSPDNLFSHYYKPTPWYFPNTFHTFFCAIFPSVEFGNKIFHILNIALLQISLYLVIKELKGNLWYGLLGLLFTYNYNVTFGFVGFAISIPTTLLLFYVILIDLRKNTLVLKVCIALLLIVLYWMHAQTALFGLLLTGFMVLYSFHKALWQMIWRVAFVSLPVLLFIVIWWINKGTGVEPNEKGTLEFLKEYYSSVYLRDFFDRMRLVANDNFQLYEGYMGIIVGIVIFLCAFFPLLYFKTWRIGIKDFFGSPNLVYAFILVFVSAGCYFVLPDKLPGQSPLYQRFCTLVLLSVIILGSVLLKSIDSTKLKYYSSVLIIVYSGLWIEYFYTFNNENSSFTKSFFSETPSNSKLGGLIYDNEYRGRQVYIHFPNYFLVWNKGIIPSKIIDYRFGIVRRAAPEAELPFYYEYIGSSRLKVRPKIDYSMLEYLLIRGTLNKLDVNEEDYTLINKAGLWQLYRRSGHSVEYK